MANFCPQIVISNFFLIFLQDSWLGSAQQTVKKWLIGKEFLPPAKQYFCFVLIKHTWNLKIVPKVPFVYLPYNFWTISNKIGHCKALRNQRTVRNWLIGKEFVPLFVQSATKLAFLMIHTEKAELRAGVFLQKMVGSKFLRSYSLSVIFFSWSI